MQKFIKKGKGMEIQYKNQEPIYKIYARTDGTGMVIKIFSDCFEQPKQEDILLKSGRGDEFVHVGDYKILTKERAHRYKIVAGELTERTKEEMAEEIAKSHQPESEKERLVRLEKENLALKEQQAEQDEIILENHYHLLLMQENIEDIV